MSDTTTAQIKAKGCQSTGISEELAIKLHDQLGKKIMCIVELESSARTENTDGDQKVQLKILSVEPATDQIAEDHLRDVQRAMYMNRQLHDEQPTLDGDGPEPTVKEVIQGRGEAILERDDETGEVVGLWDGNTDQLAEDWVNSQHGDEPEEPDTDDPAYEPHPYIDTAHATCGYKGCGQPAGAAIHTTSDEPVSA